MMRWLKRLWERRPLTRFAAARYMLAPGDVVWLRDNPHPLTVKEVQVGGVSLKEPEVENALLRADVCHGVPWKVFNAQVMRINLRKVW